MGLKGLLALCALVFGFAQSASAIPWRGVFIAGDDSIENFDNGREDLTAAFSARGTFASIAQLSSSSRYIGKNGVVAADADGVYDAFAKMGRQEGEGCFIHMTSHGAKHAGFYLSRTGGVMSPQVLAELVNRACGDAPTVIMVSACYSGQFIAQGLTGPNRVILTAARQDRPSFGCSADTEYTYWDECVLTSLPNSQSFQELYHNAATCIAGKEAALGERPSEPQAFFGENTANWTILF